MISNFLNKKTSIIIVCLLMFIFLLLGVLVFVIANNYEIVKKDKSENIETSTVATTTTQAVTKVKKVIVKTDYFKLILPKTWKDAYISKEVTGSELYGAEYMLDFYEKDGYLKGEASYIFGICLTQATEAEIWQMPQKDTGSTLLGMLKSKNSGTSYSVQAMYNTGFDAVSTKQYMDMVDDIDIVCDSFKASKNYVFVPYSQKPTTTTLYRVRVGAYSNKLEAQGLISSLQAYGFETYFVQNNGLYSIQVGAYSQRENAEAMIEKLSLAGFNGYITQEVGTPVETVVGGVYDDGPEPGEFEDEISPRGNAGNKSE